MQRVKVQIQFRWFDMWIGVFIKPHATKKQRALGERNYETVLYICPLPMVVIKITIADKDKEVREQADSDDDFFDDEYC